MGGVKGLELAPFRRPKIKTKKTQLTPPNSISCMLKMGLHCPEGGILRRVRRPFMKIKSRWVSEETIRLFSGELISEAWLGNPFLVRLSRWFSSLSTGGRKGKVSSNLRSFRYYEVVPVFVPE